MSNLLGNSSTNNLKKKHKDKKIYNNHSSYEDLSNSNSFTINESLSECIKTNSIAPNCTHNDLASSDQHEKPSCPNDPSNNLSHDPDGVTKKATMINITKEFFEASKELRLGELFHDRYFGLYEAMSAIEMMDPKMDAGMVCNKAKINPSMKSSLKLDGFSPEELIGIIDATFSCLVTWLEGHSLAQTVFTNLYLHNPNNIKDKTLKSFCIGILKLIDIIVECAYKASVYEEEDFQAALCGYNLASSVSEAEAINLLKEGENELNKQVKQLNSKKKEESDASVEDLTSKLVSLSHRLRFTRVFYQSFLNIWKNNVSTETTKNLNMCIDSLSVMQKSLDDGIKRSDPESGEFMMGFDLLVNQRLLPPTFPRSTDIKSGWETLFSLQLLTSRIKNVLKVSGCGDFHSVLEFFMNFSDSGPCVLSRSLLQLLYSPLRFNRPPLVDMVGQMKTALKHFIAPPILFSKASQNNKEIGQCLNMFFERCAPSFGSLLILCGHNRARQRDKLIAILEDFGNLQNETERMDAHLQSLSSSLPEPLPHLNSLSTWVLYHLTRLMLRYLFSGFELSLYSPHELIYIYWYSAEVLFPWLLSSLSTADSLLESSSSLGEKGGGGGGRKRRERGGRNGNKKYKAGGREINTALAQQHLAGGIFRAIVGLTIDHKIPVPNPEFDNESVRYRHRFSAFNSISTPAPVTYAQYSSTISEILKQSSESMYSASGRSFNQAKAFLEAIPTPEKEVGDLLKIAKTNLVVVKLLASGHTRNSTSPPEFDFTCNIHFPIIKIK